MSSVPEIRIVGSGTEITSTSTLSSYFMKENHKQNVKDIPLFKSRKHAIECYILSLPLDGLFCGYRTPVVSPIGQSDVLVQEIL